MSDYILNTNQLQKIFEELDLIQGTPLYHHTSEDRAVQIMDQNKLRGSFPSEDYLELDTRLKKSKDQAAISLTRDKNFIPGISIGSSWEKPKDLNVIFVLDSNKLKTRYRVEPFNYSFLDPVIQKDSQRYERNPELEERVLTKEIYPLKKYVTDIIYKGRNPIVRMKIDEFLEETLYEHTINELAPHSAGVKEFINHAKETPGLLKFLGFRSFKDLENYITDGDYKDFQELKKDAKDFQKTIKENEEKKLPIAIKKIFKLLDSLKKTKRKKKELEEYLEKTLEYIGIPQSAAKYYLEAYLLNFRKDGNYEELTPQNFVDPRFGKARSTINTDAFKYTKSQMPFYGSNIKGLWEKDRNGVPQYVVLSYGWYPIFIFKNDKWYEVYDKFSSSTARQISNSDPTRIKRWDRNWEADVYLLTKEEMEILRNGKFNHEQIMDFKKQKLLKSREEIQKKRASFVSAYGGWGENSPNTKIKFKIKDVQEKNNKTQIFVDIIDVVKNELGKGIPTPENYTKGELQNITKEKVERDLTRRLLREFMKYIGTRMKNWTDVDMSDKNIEFVYNHLREKE